MKKTLLLLLTLMCSVVTWATQVEVISTLNLTQTFTFSTNDSKTVGAVKITATKGSANWPVFNYNATEGVDLRFYKGSTVTFSVPNGNKIESITFNNKLNGSGTYTSANKNTLNNNLSTNVGTFADGVWTAPSQATSSVTYTCGSENNVTKLIYSITVVYSATSGGGDPEPQPTALSVPTNLSSSNVTTTGATLSWDAVSNASSYTVKIGETEYTGVNTNSYSATGLNAGTEYTWTVKAVGDGVNYSTSAYASNANFTTEAEQGGGDEPSGDALTVDFESETSAYGDWTFTNITTKQTNSNVTAHGGSYFGTTGGKETGSVQTKNKVNPGTITFYISKASTNTSSSSWKVQTSANGTSWTDAKTVSASSVTRGEWTEVTHTFSDLSNVYVRVYYNGTTAVRCIDDLTLTLAEAPDPDKTVKSIAVSGTPDTFWKGDEFNTNGMTVTATFDDETTGNVTSLAEFSTPDMTTVGSKTVTVTYQGKTATYDITVQTIANTQETAYTVAQAVALIDAGKDLTTEVYVTGKVCQIDSYNDTYKSITYWISEDGTAANKFEVYSGKNLNNTDFAAQSDIVLGADVVIYGVIKKYSGTYEFDKNNYLVSYTAPVVKTKPELSFAEPSVTAYLDALDEFEYLTVITNPVGLTGVQYSTSDDTKATVDANTGVVTINNEATPGTVTITASYAESEDYAAADDASYVINIVANKPVAVKRAVVAKHDDKYYAMTTTYDNKKMTAVEVSVVNNKVVYTGESDIAWNWTETEVNKGTLETNKGFGLVKSGTGTDVRLNDGTLTTTVWSIDATLGVFDVATNRPLLTNGSVWGTYAASNVDNSAYSSKASLMEIASTATISLNAACHDAEGMVYGTYSNEKAFVVPDDIIVYEVKIEDGGIYKKPYSKSDVVPANTGVLVEALSGGDYIVVIESDPETLELAESVLGADNALRASGAGIKAAEMAEKDGDSNYYYRLTMQKGTKVGFWWGADEGAAFDLAANKAYLVAPKTATTGAAKGFAFGDISTLIDAINASEKANGAAYNLAGQRVNANHKGIVIINGKKFINK